ncbi:MAG: hypothetical protein Kow00129_16750 [Thermoleophilia bacterium]
MHRQVAIYIATLGYYEEVKALHGAQPRRAGRRAHTAGGLPECPLVEVECLRTLDRLRVRYDLDEGEIALRREAIVRLLESMEVVSIGPAVLRRAGQPLPVTLGTLDALHLATVLLWTDATGELPIMATHDAALGTAARSMGLRVVGC